MIQRHPSVATTATIAIVLFPAPLAPNELLVLLTKPPCSVVAGHDVQLGGNSLSVENRGVDDLSIAVVDGDVVYAVVSVGRICWVGKEDEVAGL